MIQLNPAYLTQSGREQVSIILMHLGEILKDLPERFSLRSSYERLSKLNQCAMSHVTRICDKCDISVV